MVIHIVFAVRSASLEESVGIHTKDIQLCTHKGLLII